MDTPPSGIPGNDPLAPDEIEWLLDGLDHPSIDVQVASTRALVTLPLTPESWFAVSDRIDQLLEPATVTPELLEAATRVPTRHVRARLHTLVDTMVDPAVRLPLLDSLALAGDPAVVPSLLRMMRTNDDPATIEMLSRFAVPEARGPLLTMASNGDAETRLWASIALAQLDEPDALERLLAEPGIDDALPMLWGDPTLVHERMRGRGPWPVRTQAMLDRLATEAEGNPRPTDVIVEALLAGEPGPPETPGPALLTPSPDPARQEQARALRTVLERSFPNPAIWNDLPVEQGGYGILANLPRHETAQLVDTLWGRLAADYRSIQGPSPATDPMQITVGGNHLVKLTHDIGPAFIPDVPELGRTFLQVQDHHQLADQLGWTVGRAGMRQVVRDLGRFAGTTGGTTNLAGINLVEFAGNRVNDSAPPIYGGAAPSPQPRPITLFVDDLMTGSAPPEVGADEDVAANGHDTDDDTSTGDPSASFGHLLCPDLVQPGIPFDLEVGIAPRLADRSLGQELRVPPLSQGPYDLTVQLVAEGFTLDAGDASHRNLRVTTGNPYPKAIVRLTAVPQIEPVVPRVIQASYYIGSEHVGVAYRPLAVVLDINAGDAVRPEPLVLSATVGQPSGGQAAPDLTVEIALGEAPGSFHWTIRTDPSLGVQDPPAPLTILMEQRVAPEAFVRQLIDLMNQETDMLANRILGVGSVISDNTPSDFWATLKQVARKVQPGRPRVSLVSHDDFIPWELALMDAPIDPACPPLLGAQVTLGRWILPRPNRDKPASPPVVHQPASSMAVVCGRYGMGVDWPRLEHAEAEAAALVDRYEATDIPASAGAIKAYLNGTPRTRILHFAGHAHYDPLTAQAHGMVLDNETYLHPLDIRGKQLPSHPFVFLNACQAAAGYQMLGSCAGMVSGFVHAGASAVVAPIWSVDDKAAQEIARDFYRQVLEEDVPPAEAIRRLRARFGHDGQGNEVDPESAICLAYQFFGHPNLVLDRDAPDLEMNHA